MPANALESIILELNAERAYQDSKWGGEQHDDTIETPDTWRHYIRQYALGKERGVDYDFRKRMLKCGALALAAVESWDRMHNPDQVARREVILQQAIESPVLVSGVEDDVVRHLHELTDPARDGYRNPMVWVLGTCIRTMQCLDMQQREMPCGEAAEAQEASPAGAG